MTVRVQRLCGPLGPEQGFDTAAAEVSVGKGGQGGEAEPGKAARPHVYAV
jgi:hypothetical protein